MRGKRKSHRWIRPLLCFHLFVLVAILALFRTSGRAEWTIHAWVLAVLAVQFTWSFTVGLIVGPSRARRRQLRWSAASLFIPLWPMKLAVWMLLWSAGPLVAALYAAAFAIVLGSETIAGLLLGVKMHSEDAATDD